MEEEATLSRTAGTLETSEADDEDLLDARLDNKDLLGSATLCSDLFLFE